MVIDNKDLEDYLIALNKRLENLETGGKPIVGKSVVGASGSVTINAGAMLTALAATLTWNDTNVNAVMGAVPYITIRVDTDDAAHNWPYGASLSSGQRALEIYPYMDEAHLASDPNEARLRLVMKNVDSNNHNYFVYINFTLVEAGSNSF